MLKIRSLSLMIFSILFFGKIFCFTLKDLKRARDISSLSSSGLVVADSFIKGPNLTLPLIILDKAEYVYSAAVEESPNPVLCLVRALVELFHNYKFYNSNYYVSLHGKRDLKRNRAIIGVFSRFFAKSLKYYLCVYLINKYPGSENRYKREVFRSVLGGLLKTLPRVLNSFLRSKEPYEDFKFSGGKLFAVLLNEIFSSVVDEYCGESLIKLL